MREPGQDTLGWPEDAGALLETVDEADDTDGADDADGVAIIDATVERARHDATQWAHYLGKKKVELPRCRRQAQSEEGRQRWTTGMSVSAQTSEIAHT